MNIRQRFLENAAKASVSNRDRILTAAIEAYCPGVTVFHFKEKLVCTRMPNGDEIYSYDGDPIIRFAPPEYGWQQKPESFSFNVSQQYELLFDVEDQA